MTNKHDWNREQNDSGTVQELFTNRRRFMQAAGLGAAGLTGLGGLAAGQSDDNIIELEAVTVETGSGRGRSEYVWDDGKEGVVRGPPADLCEHVGGNHVWVGVSPDSIADVTNPTLELTAGESYTVEWTNTDGETHNFAIIDADGNELISSANLNEEGETQTVEFEATEEMAEYYCGSHTGAQRGTVEVADAPTNNEAPVAVQLYTLRDLPDSVLDLIRRVGGVDNNGGPGYDAVEFAGLGDASTDEINTAFSETGVSAAAAHVALDELEGDSFESTVQTYLDVGVDTFVVPYIDPGAIDTVQKVENLAERMNSVAANLEEYDATLGFHNHAGEFQTIGEDQTPLEVFDANLADEVIFELDVGWVLTAGYDPVNVIRQYSDRTQLVHMKDMADGEFYTIGEGAVDMGQVADVARNEANVDYLIYEHDAPADPAGTLGTGAGVLSFLDGRSGLECLDFADVGSPDYDGSISGVEMGDPADEDGIPTGIQLYTLRNLPDSTPELIRRVGSIDNNGGPGYNTVEFAGLDGSVSDIQAALEETGIEAASAHIGLGNLEGDSLDSTVETYSQLGVNNYIEPVLTVPDDPTIQNVQNLAQRFNDVNANLPDGARVGFHNHDAVFQEMDDGRTILAVLDEHLDDEVIFEIDVGWVLTAGYDPVDVISQYSDRTELLHMKDMADGEFREIGEGAVDWEEIAQVARDEADVDYLIYEHDAPVDPAGSTGTGAGVLSFLDDAPGLDCLQLSHVGGPDYDGTLSGDGPDTEPGDGDRGQISAPFGFDSGGGEVEGSVMIDGVEFVAESDAVEPYGDQEASTNGTAVAVGSTSPDDPIDGTDHDALYQSEQWGGNLSYDVSIENGTYDVTLHFAEIYFGGDFNGDQIDGGTGSRVFNVAVQGQDVFSDLDIYDAVGHDVALTETIEGVEVTDGNLSITTTTQAENSKFSGFEIRPAGDSEDSIQEGLEAHITLDDDTPTNAVTEANLEVQGDVTTGQPGVIGNAVEVHTNDTIDSAGDAIISEPLPLNGEGATVGAWMNITDLEEYGRAPFQVGGDPNSTPTNGWDIEFSGTDSALTAQLWQDGGTGAGSDGNPINIDLETWYFVVAVVEGGDLRLHVFDQSGELDASPQSWSGGSRTQSDAEPLILGAGDGRDMAGRIDDVWAYSQALSESEVAQLYTQTSSE